MGLGGEEEVGTHSQQTEQSAEREAAQPIVLEAPRHLVWLLLRDPCSLDEQERQTLDLIRQEPRVARLYELTQCYVKLMRERDFEAFDPWLDTCLRCGIPDLESFAQGLQNDYEAVKASLIFSYSNGPVEGQVNRLKFVKRSMFGRGHFALLRQRFLAGA